MRDNWEGGAGGGEANGGGGGEEGSSMETHKPSSLAGAGYNATQ